MSVSSLARNGNLICLLISDAILVSAMPMLVILGGLSGLMLAPTTALATLPASLQTLAWLLAAAPFSLFMGKFGRRPGFILGVGLTILGAALGVWALMSGSFVLICASHLILGIGLTSHQYFRFAAAEVVSKEWRPVAISLMLTSGLIASFIGPQIFILAKDALAPIPLAGGAMARLWCFHLLARSHFCSCGSRSPRKDQHRDQLHGSHHWRCCAKYRCLRRC